MITKLIGKKDGMEETYQPRMEGNFNGYYKSNLDVLDIQFKRVTKAIINRGERRRIFSSSLQKTKSPTVSVPLKFLLST